MKITDARFITSQTELSKFPSDCDFEVVLIGKSNVGKSSFINKMLERTSLARTGAQPGRTRTANFYMVNERFYFVDMPGYGYAKVSKTQRESFSKIISQYLNGRKTDFLVLFLIDYRHEPTSNDIEMMNKIRKAGICPVIILTKADKVKNSLRASNLKVIKNTLQLDDDDAVFPCSAQTGEGTQKIWDFIDSMLEE